MKSKMQTKQEAFEKFFHSFFAVSQYSRALTIIFKDSEKVIFPRENICIIRLTEDYFEIHLSSKETLEFYYSASNILNDETIQYEAEYANVMSI